MEIEIVTALCPHDLHRSVSEQTLIHTHTNETNKCQIVTELSTMKEENDAVKMSKDIWHNWGRSRNTFLKKKSINNADNLNVSRCF